MSFILQSCDFSRQFKIEIKLFPKVNAFFRVHIPIEKKLEKKNKKKKQNKKKKKNTKNLSSFSFRHT